MTKLTNPNKMIKIATNPYGVLGLLVTDQVRKYSDMNKGWLEMQKQKPVEGEDFIDFIPFVGGAGIVQLSHCTDIQEITASKALELYSGWDCHAQHFTSTLNRL
ncbi:hypothetical protein [Vibrio phage YC]|uniref:Uncharacterized protein n=1 Tax=Vibrio phage YC TaxID=2267403 RepID=A0A384ZS47_9CAUD|nr:hypothetical protein HWB64_gp094 [Vibrio phage YC]AXC34463.1 hypothetical protein [Vibrio phage YC]